MKTKKVKITTDTVVLQKAFALACRFLSDYLGCPPECEGVPEKCKVKDTWQCWQRYLQNRAENEGVCRMCGCTQDNACEDGCYWVEPDLCSHCE